MGVACGRGGGYDLLADYARKTVVGFSCLSITVQDVRNASVMKVLRRRIVSGLSALGKHAIEMHEVNVRHTEKGKNCVDAFEIRGDISPRIAAERGRQLHLLAQVLSVEFLQSFAVALGSNLLTKSKIKRNRNVGPPSSATPPLALFRLKKYRPHEYKDYHDG